MPHVTLSEDDEQTASAPQQRAGRRPGRGIVVGKRLRPRTRWLLRCIFFLPLLTLLGVLLLMRSPVVGWVVERQLEAAVGCDARVETAVVTFDGRIVLRGISLRVPGMSGPQGEFVRALRAEIDADWSRVLSGVVKPTGIRLHAPLFRVSAGENDSVLNIQSLHPTNPGAISGGKPVRIDVVSGVVELGEHSATDYRVLREIGVSGELAPSGKEPGVYQVRFQERHDPASGRPRERAVGMMLDGRIDLQSSIAVIRLLNVDLTTWEPTGVPTLLRDVWEQLNVKGRIASTSLEYFPTTGLTAVVTLDEVSMDAIVPANFAKTGPMDDVLSLRKVHGTIKLSPSGIDADVAGLVENQTFPSRVVLKTHDLTTDAALDCKIISRSFQLEKDPTLLPFCPPVVADRLANFCGPTGVLDADVVIRRGPPGPDGPAEFKIAGWLNFEHGVAAFDRVPYPFTEMRGRVEFDNDSINILHIDGVGPNGSVVSARGRIAPPNHDAEVTIEVNVRNVPLDRTFMESLPPSRAEAIDFLFNRARYEELLEAGLVSEPGGGGDAPEFALGGRMDVDVVVRSPLGHDTPWTYTADVTIPRAGVLPRAFPLPIAAQDIRLRLTDTDARLLAGRFVGLRGGATGVSAEVLLEADGQDVIRPSVIIDAHDVPLDDLLLHAIAHASGGDETPAPTPDALPSPAALLRTLDLAGNVDCRAELTTTPDDTIDFDIAVVFDELEARPRPPGSAPLISLTDIAGSIRLTNSSMEVPRLTASLRALEGIETVSTEVAAGADLGWLGLSLTGELSGIDTSLTTANDAPRSHASLAAFAANVELTGLNLLAPIEEPLAAFAPGLAEKIVALRSERRPSGRVSASIDLAKGGEEAPFHIAARLTAADNLMFDAAGEQFDGTIHSGVIKLDSARGGLVEFDNVRAEVGVGKAPRSVFGLDGTILLDPAPGVEGARALRITGERIAVESAAVSLALRHVLPGDDLATVAAASPTGLFDATVEVPSAILLGDAGEGRALASVTATIVPHSLEFDFEGSRVVIGDFEGRLLIDASGLDVDGIIARAEDWAAHVDGAWARDADGAGVFNASLRVDADSLTPGIRALFPVGLRKELDRIKLAIDGPLHSENAAIQYRAGGRSTLTGELHFSGASLDVGAPLTDAQGRLVLLAERTGAASPWSFGLDLEADRVEAAGLAMTDLRAHLDVGKKPGEVVLESLSADCYAGRVSAKAHIVDSTNAGGARYDADITMAGVCFAPVLAALESARLRSEGWVPEPMPTELITDPRRGRLDGTLAISGTAGESRHRSGVGSVRIANGDVVEMPLVLTLVQLSNFQVPSNDRLDFLQAIFHVQEDEVVFDQIDLLSSSVAIAGRGTMSWPDQELDLRFNSRAGIRVPILSALFEALRDEIATTRIRGTLSDPRVGPEPLVGTRELIGNIMGDHAGVKRSFGLPDAAAERRRQRGQRPHPPQVAQPGRATDQPLPSTAGVNPDR